MRTFWALAVLPLVAVAQLTCRTRSTERYGQDLLQRNEWGSNAVQMTMVDIGKPLRAGILERFMAYLHRDNVRTIRMRFQIWYPVDENRGSYRLDYEQIVDIPPSNGRYVLRSIEANGCYRVLEGSHIGWTLEQNVHPIMYNTDRNYPMLYRQVARSDLFPQVGATYTLRDGQSFGVTPAVFSVAVDIGQVDGISGPVGNVGATGRTGRAGSAGPSGARGTDGATGERGPEGTPGRPGSPGRAGEPGRVTGDTRMGIDGPIGVNGPKGEIGITGSRGSVGRVGAAGAIGVTGRSGAAGATGQRGSDGQPGRDGRQGATGIAGPNGSPGRAGPSGQSGRRGETGPKGSIGERGISGRPGANGLPGATGLAGIPGLDGQDGLTGPQGRAGLDGQSGSPGQVGATGLSGINGAPGRIGPAGIQGAAGSVGQSGPLGAQGGRGLDGRQGANGVPGRDGGTGGTGQPGLPGIKGEPGLRGIDGSPGAPGSLGLVGFTGQSGAPGPDGRNGPTGATGDIGIDGPPGNRGLTGTVGATGVSGITGRDGSPGRNGNIGQVGPKGATGFHGIPGRAGLPGNVGATGLSGPIGLPGSIGREGSIGLPGSDGRIGAQGATGISGRPGTRGPNGAPGRLGATGVAGQRGIPGLDGEKGTSGSIGRDGLPGAVGATGEVGPIGSPGRNGFAGADGETGLSGANGRDGIPGSRGIQGVIGAPGQPGAAGNSGYPGNTGATGANGLPGLSGLQGANGYTGRAGRAGIPGLTGATGDQGLAGLPGSAGLRGLAGAAGEKGFTGDTGRDGAPGRNGLDGAPGQSGPAGAIGSIGATGLSGLRGGDGRPGSRGQTGYTGAQGLTGRDGAAGLAGLDGTPGTRGAPGISGNRGATGIAGSRGNVGSRGRDGSHGFTGHTGPIGAQGTRGVLGETGATGATGSRGLAGSNGQFGRAGPIGADGPTGFTGQPGRPGEAGQRGSTGAPGLTGAQGVNGSPGRAGNIGAPGVTGLTGLPGPSGQLGQIGAPGPAGLAGPSGFQGTNGLAGTIGAAGPRGFDGSPGAPGQDGLQGFTGRSGSPGEPGLAGVRGIPGQNGINGSPGATGSVGTRGLDGLPGPRGENGIAGAAGPRGVSGRAGAAGLRGERGENGQSGSAGRDGSRGAPGARGLDGRSGSRGTDGPAGWTGPAGAPGQIGSAGQRGRSGSRGAPGRSGTQGIIGSTGAAGRNGSPGAAGERGVDGVRGFTGQAGIPGSPGRTDENECFVNNGGCAHICVNLFGSYMCQCRNGYKLQNDQRSCIDIDECLEYGPCHQRCINTQGSFRCECLNGFTVDSRNRAVCVDRDECREQNPCPAEQSCANTYGGYKCLKIQTGLNIVDLRCNYEERSLCKWLQVQENWYYFDVSLSDDFDWIIDSGQSGIIESGPDQDHTSGRGNYIYLPSSTVRVGAAAWFTTGLVSNRAACMSFWFHMNGREMGTLKLHQMYLAGREGMVTLWELSGDRGNEWKQARVSIPLVSRGDYYVLLFEGVTGGRTSEMALDDLSFTEGECTALISAPEDLTCDFRNNERNNEICRWDQVGGNWLQFNVALKDDLDWIIQSGRTTGVQTGPERDHTTGSGNYIYLPTSSGFANTGNTAWFSTHLVLNRNAACMEFYYHMYGREMGTLTLHQLYNDGLRSMKTLWELSGDRGNVWHKAKLTIPLAPSSDYYVLLFKGTVGGQTSDMAVDDIRVTSGPCVLTAEPVNPEMVTCNLDDATCPWEQVLVNWKQLGVTLIDNFDWITAGGSSNPQTGPGSDHTSGNGKYLHLAASTTQMADGNIVGKTAMYATHRIFNREPACMTFWYHMHGREMGTMRLHQLYDAGLDAMVKLWELSGDQGNEWKQKELDLPLVASGQYYILIFEGVMGGALSDMAIDDVLVKAGACAQPDVLCSFDDVNCPWDQVGGATLAFGEQLRDDFDWTVLSGQTRSSQTGPSAGYNGYGKYMYLEASSPAKKGDRAWFMSHAIVAKTACLTFNYHMFGVDTGELKVYQLYNAGLGHIVQLWDKKADQGNTWHEAKVNLPYVQGETFRVLIEGIVGNGFKGDIAIDNIKYIPESCSGGNTGVNANDICSFEPNDRKCSWTQVEPSGSYVLNQLVYDDLDWSQNRGSTPSRNQGERTGPNGDHTSGLMGQGHYMYLESSSPARAGNTAWLVSTTMNFQRACMHFWYHMHGRDVGSLNVYQLDRRGSSGKHSLWQKYYDQGNAWELAEVSIPDIRDEFALVIEAVVGNGREGDIAIDDIRIWEGDCQQAIAQYGQVKDLRKDVDTRKSGMLMESPAAFALFGGMALMSLLIAGLVLVAYKQRRRRLSTEISINRT